MRYLLPILLAIVISAVAMFIFLNIAGVHPLGAEGYMLWFFVFFIGFLLLGL